MTTYENNREMLRSVSQRLADGELRWVNGLVRLWEDERETPTQREPGEIAINPKLGIGILSIDGDTKAPALVQPSEVAQVPASFTQWQISKIESLEQLKSTLSVSAAAAYSDVGMDMNAAASLYRQASLETYTFVILVRCVHTTLEQTFQSRDILLVDEIPTLAVAERFDAIGRKYGDSYVNSVLYGGEYLAYINLSTSNQTEYERISLAASGSYGNFDASGDFESSFSRLKRITNLSGTQIIKGVASPVPGWNQVEAFALNFPTLIANGNNAVPTLYRTERLDETVNWPALSILDFHAEEERITDLLEVLGQCRALRSNWQYIEKFPWQFVGGASKEAQLIVGELIAIDKQINKEIQEVKRHIGKYIAPSPLPRYDLDPYSLLPPRMGVLRSQIRARWIEGSPSGALCPPPTYTEEITNRHDTGNTGLDWIRSTSGHASSLFAVSVETLTEMPGVELWMRLRAGTPNPIDGKWERAANLQYTSSGFFLSGIAFQLRGPMADQYFIDYMVHCNDVGTSEYRWGNSPGCTQPAGEFAQRSFYPIQGFRLVVYPRGAF